MGQGEIRADPHRLYIGEEGELPHQTFHFFGAEPKGARAAVHQDVYERRGPGRGPRRLPEVCPIRDHEVIPLPDRCGEVLGGKKAHDQDGFIYPQRPDRSGFGQRLHPEPIHQVGRRLHHALQAMTIGIPLDHEEEGCSAAELPEPPQVIPQRLQVYLGIQHVKQIGAGFTRLRKFIGTEHNGHLSRNLGAAPWDKISGDEVRS